MSRSEPDAGTTEQYLVQSARQLARQVEGAEESESWVAAVQAKKAEMAVRAQLDQLRERQRLIEEQPESVDAHRAEVRLVVRRMRIAAMTAGSHVAAANLLRLEEDILSRAQAEADAAEAARLAQMRIDEIRDEIEQLRAQRALH